MSEGTGKTVVCKVFIAHFVKQRNAKVTIRYIVQSLLKERAFVTTHPKRVASNYLLSGLARCGYCGKALVGQDAKGGQFHYYVCGTLLKKGAGSCSAPYINSQKF